eukprot:CAMPEP_0181386614 /NCGR_PEP_ID=MMETSP1106-20121128/23241_1 /TAXON_ID=81844 /ORGANISM="Mantoniella antarctica, Strain SL-175" /LENGTH=83 /DNA_ID=CAMNT_0023506861 /DNA_START=55 /DNA_END=307 /DNA_ORIENTATION=+
MSTDEEHLALVTLALVDLDHCGLEDGAARQRRKSLEAVSLANVIESPFKISTLAASLTPRRVPDPSTAYPPSTTTAPLTAQHA